MKALAVVLMLLSVPLHAATIDVVGRCTLQNAIHSANLDRSVGGCRKGLGPDTIRLSIRPTLRVISRPFQTPEGPVGLPTITSKITIVGLGDDGATIMRNPSGPKFRIFMVAPNGNLSLRRLVIRNGDVRIPRLGRDIGSAIFNEGILSITGSHITANASTYANDGVIASGGTMSMSHSSVIDNEGTGIFIYSGIARLSQSTISGNELGIDNDGNLYAKHLTIIGKETGILNSGYLSLDKCLISQSI